MREVILCNSAINASDPFSGRETPVTITIYNKLDEPLYVDLGPSVLIIDDVRPTPLNG